MPIVVNMLGSEFTKHGKLRNGKSVVVLGCNGACSSYHYIAGYHGPGCIQLDIVFLYSPWGLYLMLGGVI